MREKLKKVEEMIKTQGLTNKVKLGEANKDQIDVTVIDESLIGKATFTYQYI